MGSFKCEVCGSNLEESYKIKERLLNRGEYFNYYFCPNCKTLQMPYNIDVSSYYSADYYAFNQVEKHISPLKKEIKRLVARFCIFHDVPLLVRNLLKEVKLEVLNPLCGTKIDKDKKILDIGCGNGMWLQQMAEFGFTDLTGVDLYSRPPKSNSWKFVSGEIGSIGNESFDVISIQHAFEHMKSPLMVMQELKNHLNDGGVILLRIPVVNEAWREFGENWYQIDAPRHFFLYSVEAVKLLCKKSGLKIHKIVYDSSELQFRYSRAYRDTNLSLPEIERGGYPRRIGDKIRAFVANMRGYGDQCIFYIGKCEETDHEKCH